MRYLPTYSWNVCFFFCFNQPFFVSYTEKCMFKCIKWLLYMILKYSCALHPVIVKLRSSFNNNINYNTHVLRDMFTNHWKHFLIFLKLWEKMQSPLRISCRLTEQRQHWSAFEILCLSDDVCRPLYPYTL